MLMLHRDAMPSTVVPLQQLPKIGTSRRADVPIAIPTIQTETDEVRVTQWRLPPGSATGHHRHEFDYVVVPMTHGTLTLVTADGSGEGRLTAGQAYFRKAGVEHDVINCTAG